MGPAAGRPSCAAERRQHDTGAFVKRVYDFLEQRGYTLRYCTPLIEVGRVSKNQFYHFISNTG